MKSKKIKEQIDYGDYPERMDPSIQSKLEKGETPYSEHPAMPEGEKNFDQIVASKRFKDVVDKFQRYAGTRAPLRGANAFQRLMMSAMQMVTQINQIEQQNKQYLENLAIDLVKKQMGIPEGKINFIAELVPFGTIRPSEEMQGEPEEFSDEEIQDAFEENSEEAEEHTEDLLNFADAFEKFDLEKAKRRFMNSIIQGASKKGHYMFELVRDEIERINPQLMNLYGVSMASLDYLYWLYPEQVVQQMAASGEGQAGQEEVDLQTDPPTVKAKAISFPILVHELLKGVYDILGAHGLPDDPRRAEMVKGSEDTLPAEIWDIRLGPIFWEKFLETYPDELFEEDKKHIQNYLFSRFSMISASEFLALSKEILAGTQKGKSAIKRMVDEITNELKQQDYEKAIGDYEDEDEEDDDIDLGFLGDLGISPSK
jgi:nitrate reductase assembly molybdenum cofactor insertion protein NarJ